MTMDSERKRAVLWTEAFLMRLRDPRQTPGVPEEIRQEAASCLRHYPTRMELRGWDGGTFLQAEEVLRGEMGEI